VKDPDAKRAAQELNSDLARLQIDVASALARWPQDAALIALDRIVNGCDCDYHTQG
jgi:hypothetical protein